MKKDQLCTGKAHWDQFVGPKWISGKQAEEDRRTTAPSTTRKLATDLTNRRRCLGSVWGLMRDRKGKPWAKTRVL
ncbi:hypothetical protein AN958_05596 [Leucoagaricus sp. SymC.cos]|nr:hypothetical protein AN958_05596 [Leucoagaricus sp. SymC.cos]